MYCQYWTTNNAGIYLEKNIFKNRDKPTEHYAIEIRLHMARQR